MSGSAEEEEKSEKIESPTCEVWEVCVKQLGLNSKFSTVKCFGANTLAELSAAPACDYAPCHRVCGNLDSTLCNVLPARSSVLSGSAGRGYNGDKTGLA
jgi:hypothetical protein